MMIPRICFLSTNTWYVRVTKTQGHEKTRTLIRKGKGTDYVVGWKPERVYNSKLEPLYPAFLHGIKLSEYKVRIKFDKDRLAVEQTNYATKIVNAYIAYDLDTWPNNPLRIFTLKNWLFGATSIVKNSNKEKKMYSGYWIEFVGRNTWIFGNDYARNVVIFSVDNSSLTHADTDNNNF